MNQHTIKITLVIFHIKDNTLCVFLSNKQLPSAIISETATLEEQVEKIFDQSMGFPLKNNYNEQLYTISPSTNEVMIVYYVLLADAKNQPPSVQQWEKVTSKHFSEKSIISYALQRLRWKIEYTNVVYSLLPKTFTLSELQKTYEIILGEKLDKRNFRKKILSLKFLKPTKEKKTVNSRPAQMYTFIKRTPQIVKVFS